MLTPSNLISDSILVNETIKLLQLCGGTANAVDIVEIVMKISNPIPDLAKLLVADVVKNDPRLSLNDNIVELIPLDHDTRNLFETDYVVFDFETTGAKVPPCRVTEIGAYRVKDGKIVDEFQSLINPECEIPIFITQLTGISDSMVRNAPKFAEIAEDLLDFMGDSVLVAHNAEFDMKFLNHEVGLIHQGYRMKNPQLCTVKLSRRLLPHIENHKLKTVSEHFCIDLTNHHRAAADAHATAKVFINLLDDLQSKGVNDLAGARKFKITN
jgi:DNA polymerase III epsilon subunit family exonuclease